VLIHSLARPPALQILWSKLARRVLERGREWPFARSALRLASQRFGTVHSFVSPLAQVVASVELLGVALADNSTHNTHFYLYWLVY